MARFLILAALIVCATASGYGGSESGAASTSSAGGYSSGGAGMSSAGGYGGSMKSASAGKHGGMAQGGYGGGSQGGYGSGGMAQGGYGGGAGQVVQAAIQSRHQVSFRDVPSSGEVKPTTIEVGANSVPLNILFRSASSNLNIQQAHDGAQGSVQETSSEDEPHRLIHSVTKPIIQEVHEVITPMRKITQEIQPVQEEILTIVARGQEQEKGYGAGQSSAGGYGGSSAGSSGGYGGASAAPVKGLPKPQASSYASAGASSMARKGY